ncbi:hypothetical protein I3842_06G057400 [Carya illinoinensis]|uniref:Uncharacterized protein n=1 Tax=Carya illinoinensis TaxID=32201 RepID=A0A922EUR5_CARIL|nr:hypothetical protein I3842_06G057400 [Carya illinoinensis]
MHISLYLKEMKPAFQKARGRSETNLPPSTQCRSQTRLATPLAS